MNLEWVTKIYGMFYSHNQPLEIMCYTSGKSSVSNGSEFVICSGFCHLQTVAPLRLSSGGSISLGEGGNGARGACWPISEDQLVPINLTTPPTCN